jgi:glutamine synthetase
MADETKQAPGATPKDVIKRAKEAGVKFVDVRFTDLPGTWQHFSIPVSELTDDLFENGIGFDGSSIRGFQKIFESSFSRTRVAASSTRAWKSPPWPSSATSRTR